MRFREVCAIALATSLLILAANASPKPDDNGGEQKPGTKSKAPGVISDSESFINSNTRGSSSGSGFSNNRRKTREASKVNTPESESVIAAASPRRAARSAEDYDDEASAIETTPSPLENSGRSDSDDTDVSQGQPGDEETQKITEESPVDVGAFTALNPVEEDDESSTEPPDARTERGETTSGNSIDAEQTTISSDLHAAGDDVASEPRETTTLENFETVKENEHDYEGTNTPSDDDLPVISSTESKDDDTQTTENSESSTNAEDPSYEDVTEITDSPVERTSEGSTGSSMQVEDTTVVDTEGPTDYVTEVEMESTTAYTTVGDTGENSKTIYNYFVYDDETNVPCTLANMSVSLKVSYSTKHNRIVSSEFPVPDTATASGSCGKKQSDLTLSWPSYTSANPDSTGENRITFEIANDGAFFYVSGVKVNVTLDSEDYSNAAESTLAGNSSADLRLFAAPLKSGFHVCSSTTEILCGQIVVKIKDVSLVAYNDRKDHSVREQELCQPSKTVSLAAVLGGLVAVAAVLCIVGSYVWHRKRANTFRSELP